MDNLTLERWRGTSAVEVLRVYSEHLKQDASFDARKSIETTRWHAGAAGQDWELLCTGPKFFDTRCGKGGGGAVDLIMHLFGLSFKQAVASLKERGI